MKNNVENIIPEKIRKILRGFSVSEIEVEKTLIYMKNNFPKDIYEKTVNKWFDSLEAQLILKTFSEIKF